MPSLRVDDVELFYEAFLAVADLNVRSEIWFDLDRPTCRFQPRDVLALLFFFFSEVDRASDYRRTRIIDRRSSRSPRLISIIYRLLTSADCFVQLANKQAPMETHRYVHQLSSNSTDRYNGIGVAGMKSQQGTPQNYFTNGVITEYWTACAKYQQPVTATTDQVGGRINSSGTTTSLAYRRTMRPSIRNECS